MFGISNKSYMWWDRLQDPDGDGVPVNPPIPFGNYERQHALASIDDSASSGLYSNLGDIHIDVGKTGFYYFDKNLFSGEWTDYLVKLFWDRNMQALDLMFFVDMSYSSSSHFGYWYSSDDVHPGMYHVCGSSMTVAEAIWTSINYLCSSDNYNFKPFPFLVTLQYPAWDGGPKHCVLVTGIRKFDNDHIYFLIHDPYHDSGHGIAYQQVEYEVFRGKMTLLRLDSEYLWRYMVDQEGSEPFPAFVIPLFYDKPTMNWFLNDSGYQSRSVVDIAGDYVSINAFPINSAGIDPNIADRIRTMKIDLEKRQALKRIIPIILKLLLE